MLSCPVLTTINVIGSSLCGSPRELKGLVPGRCNPPCPALWSRRHTALWTFPSAHTRPWRCLSSHCEWYVRHHWCHRARKPNATSHPGNLATEWTNPVRSPTTQTKISWGHLLLSVLIFTMNREWIVKTSKRGTNTRHWWLGRLPSNQGGLVEVEGDWRVHYTGWNCFWFRFFFV